MRRIAAALVTRLAALVPQSSRDRWREEWRAEINHASAALGRGRPASRRILRMALGACADAAAVRRVERSRLRLQGPSTSRGRLFHGLTLDFRHAARGLATAPGFSIAVVGSLTLGMAVSTAAFAMINALFFARSWH